jgi:hypothetical protein
MEDVDDDDDDDDDVGGENRSTLVLRLRRPSRNVDDRLARLESISLDHEERLKFLDPELKSTHSRIDVIESVCDANTNDLLKLKRQRTNVLLENVVYNSQSSCYSSSYNSSVTTTNIAGAAAGETSTPFTPPPTPMSPPPEGTRCELSCPKLECLSFWFRLFFSFLRSVWVECCH